MPARAGVEVIFEIGVAGGGVADSIERDFRQWRAAEIRVQDYTGRVDDPAQGRRGVSGQPAQRRLFDPSRDRVAVDLFWPLAELISRGAESRGDASLSLACDRVRQRGALQQRVD